jgi:serine/threonine protein kinase
VRSARTEVGWREATFRGAERFTDAIHIAAAGMSKTYGAFDRALAAHVWIKEVPRCGGNPDAVVHEYEMLKQLGPTGAHVLQVHHLFVGEEEVAFSSERLEGERRNGWLGRFQLDHEQLRRVLTQLVVAIDAVHRSGVLHCDIKPAHVFETHEGRLTLLGFELAVSTSEARKQGPRFAGTVNYMAPEVARGEPATEATDFYAVGTMLFEALTGRRPFDSTTSMATLLARKVREPAPSPSELVQAVPAHLDQLCSALLDRNPTNRPDMKTVLGLLGTTARGGAT